MYTRRELRTLTVAGLATPVLAGFTPRATRVGGVGLGVQTFSFRALSPAPGTDPIDVLIQAITACDVCECELFAPQVEAQFGGPHSGHHSMSSMTPQMMRRELRKWRLRTPLAYFRAIGNRFDKAGLRIYAYNYSPDPSFTSEEIDQAFATAKALGAEIITASTTLELAKRIMPFAAKHRMVVAMHGHSRVSTANELATPQGLAVAMNLSPYFKVCLDIGHFTAGNFDPVAYVRQHHGDIASIHLNDRRRNQGETVPWGQGDTPIREVLQLLKREGWPIRTYIKYNYARGTRPTVEVKKCLAYAAQALA